jgi:mRNA-degrading endonuclease toxin of MazEF toxin-antitoxin module
MCVLYGKIRGMSKPFMDWHKKKTIINDEGEPKLYHQRDIWWCSLGVNVGFEQDGTGKAYERPVLILRGFSKNVCLIIPLTSKEKKTNKYYVPVGVVDGRPASAIVSQVRLIDTKRLINKVGVLDHNRFEVIRKAVKDLL